MAKPKTKLDLNNAGDRLSQFFLWGKNFRHLGTSRADASKVREPNFHPRENQAFWKGYDSGPYAKRGSLPKIHVKPNPNFDYGQYPIHTLGADDAKTTQRKNRKIRQSVSSQEKARNNSGGERPIDTQPEQAGQAGESNVSARAVDQG